MIPNRPQLARQTRFPLVPEILTVATDTPDLAPLTAIGIDPLTHRSTMIILTILDPLVILAINPSYQRLDEIISLKVSLIMTPIKLTQSQLEIRIRTFSRQPSIKLRPVSPIIIHQIPAAQLSLPARLGVEPNQE